MGSKGEWISALVVGAVMLAGMLWLDGLGISIEAVLIGIAALYAAYLAFTKLHHVFAGLAI